MSQCQICKRWMKSKKKTKRTRRSKSKSKSKIKEVGKNKSKNRSKNRIPVLRILNTIAIVVAQAVVTTLIKDKVGWALASTTVF